jgi:hypothetical protein
MPNKFWSCSKEGEEKEYEVVQEVCRSMFIQVVEEVCSYK